MKLKQEPTLNPSPPHNPPSNSYNWHTNSRSSSSDMDSEIAVQVVIIFHILAFLLCIGCVVTWSILLCGKQRYNQQKAANIVNLFINCLTEASILVPAAVLTADLQNYSDFAYQFTGTYYVVLLWLGVFFFTPAFAGAIALICCVPKNASARRNSRGNLDTEAMMLIQASGSGQPQPPHGDIHLLIPEIHTPLHHMVNIPNIPLHHMVTIPNIPLHHMVNTLDLKVNTLYLKVNIRRHQTGTKAEVVLIKDKTQHRDPIRLVDLPLLDIKKPNQVLPHLPEGV